MSSIFLSYSRDSDKGRAKAVREKLEALGVPVFQDIDMIATSDSSEILDAQIGDASGVLVLWTKSSIKSKWVTAEAQKGLDREVLVTAVFDSISPRNLRLPFNGLTTPDISDWIETGAKASHPGWRSVLGAIGGLLHRPLVDLALAIETKSAEAKLEFLQRHPDDHFSTTFAADLKQAKKQEFDQSVLETKKILEARLVQADARLDKLRFDFDTMLESNLKSGTLINLVPRKLVDNALAEITQHDETDKSILGVKLRESMQELADANIRNQSLKADLEKLKTENTAAAVELENKSALNVKLTNDLSIKQSELSKGTTEHRPLRAAALLVLGILIGGLPIYYLRHTTANEQASARLAPGIDPQLSELKDKLKRANDALDSLNEDKQTLLSQLSASQSKLKGSEESARSLTDRVNELAKQLSDTQANLTITNDTLASLNKDKKGLLDQLGAAQSKLQDSAEKIRSLTDRGNELAKKLNDTQANLTITNDTWASLNKDKKSLLDQLGGAQSKLQDSAEKIRSLTDQGTELAKQLNDTQAKLKTAETRLRGLGGWLGVRVQQVTDDVAKSLNINPPRGALVAGVEDKGPSKPADIEPGDVIVKFDGKDVKEMTDLPPMVAGTPVGRDVEMVVIRKGQEIKKTVKLGRLAE
jgi:predicted  nucleic acid-binding Zn-ribbon protein